MSGVCVCACVRVCVCLGRCRGWGCVAPRLCSRDVIRSKCAGTTVCVVEWWHWPHGDICNSGLFAEKTSLLFLIPMLI